MESTGRIVIMLIITAILIAVAIWSIRRTMKEAARHPAAAPPGWYSYPSRPDAERWWDGAQWGRYRSTTHG